MNSVINHLLSLNQSPIINSIWKNFSVNFDFSLSDTKKCVFLKPKLYLFLISSQSEKSIQVERIKIGISKWLGTRCSRIQRAKKIFCHFYLIDKNLAVGWIVTSEKWMCMLFWRQLQIKPPTWWWPYES